MDKKFQEFKRQLGLQHPHDEVRSHNLVPTRTFCHLTKGPGDEVEDHREPRSVVKLILHWAEFFGGSEVFCQNACAERFRRGILAEYFSGGKVETISNFPWRKIPLHLFHQSNQRMMIIYIMRYAFNIHYAQRLRSDIVAKP